MSLAARLHIDTDKTGIKILACDFSFSQDVDQRGMANSDVRAGLINISIPGTDNMEILQWMLGRDTRKDCKIVFSGYVDSGSHRTIEFQDAILVNYHESYSDPSDIIIHLTFSSRIVKVKDVKHESPWATMQE
jgi:hypothetical protein